ncbi:MAG TPA: nuclear transport factor 2 family protein [Thermoanaerobaculia bacterium]|nr:nuclear transport factor 2 family protein [Thermoanaerobaculia bacterium]
MPQPFFALVLALTLGASPAAVPPAAEQLDEEGFRNLLDRLARAWHEGDSALAAGCFTEDAVYVEPPRKQLYVGRESLFRFFGGAAGRPGEMSMTWRNVVFDPRQQLGMGEFSFAYGSQVHGVAVIRVESGLIDQWREYWYESELPWKEFVEPGVP